MKFPAIHQLVKTPELDVVRVVCRKGDQVLLVKETDDPNWKLPGGKIHAGETILAAVIREIKEELDYDLTEADLLNYHPTNIPHSPDIRHIFLMRELKDNEHTTTEEVIEARYFPISNLPDGKFTEHISTAVAFVS